METHNPRTLGVCSWSLKPESPADLAAKVTACGLSAIQLALDPIRDGSWGLAQTKRALDEAGITIASGMMVTVGEDYSTLESIKKTGGLRPDQHWESNLANAKANARIACDLGISLISLHAGFLPHDESDPERAKMIERIGSIAGLFGSQGVALALETGQESAQTLTTILAEPRLAGVGVNFDPANMILYGMGDPIEAMRMLSPHTLQVHLKDAIPTQTPGEWGAEIAVGEVGKGGDGSVDWGSFFKVLSELPSDVNIMIEREGGETREADIKAARLLAESYFVKP